MISKSKELDKLLLEIYGLDVVDWSEPTGVSTRMSESLAKCYAEPGFKEYIINGIKGTYKSIGSCTPETLGYYQGRLATLFQLLEFAKDRFINYEKIKRIKAKVDLQEA